MTQVTLHTQRDDRNPEKPFWHGYLISKARTNRAHTHFSITGETKEKAIKKCEAHAYQASSTVVAIVED